MKSYNGVATLSRTKPESVRAGLDDGGEPDEPRLLHVVIGGITGPLAERCLKVEVDVEPRRAKDPSDHTFLWAEFAWP